MRYAAITVLLGLCLLVCQGPTYAQLQGSAQTFRSDPLASALQQDSVYVGKSLRGQVDANALRSIAASAPANQPAKIVVVNQLPPDGAAFGSRDAYTQALHRYLGLDRGTLLIVTPRGASASTNALDPAQITRILQQNAATLQNDPVAGSRNVIGALYGGASARVGAPVNDGAMPAPETMPARDTGGEGMLVVGIVAAGLAIGGIVVLGQKAAAKQRALAEARLPVRQLHREVVEGISYADNYLDLLPPSAEAMAAREARQSAADLLEKASRYARPGHSIEDLHRAQAWLKEAKAQVEIVRKNIDIATGGTGMAVAVEGTEFKATPAKAKGSFGAPVLNGIHPETIPMNERGACFFCSRPSRLSDLTPVTVTLNGQRRKVLACADDVHIIQQGATPEVRTVSVNGRRVPWYGSRQYDPYRDYTRTEVVYAPGYGGDTYEDGFVDALMFNTLMSEPMPMAYPVFINNAGDPTDSFQVAAPDYGLPDNTASVDFGDNTGGVDFGNSGGSDFGSTDFGGSSDSGGSVDFGGGGFDSGGGSDFGGGGGDY